MGESRRNPKIAKDGTIPLTVRLPPALHAELHERCTRDGMKLGGFIIRLLEFGLEESETVVVRKKGAPSDGASRDATVREPRRRAGGDG